MATLRAFEEELKRLVFFRDDEPTRSFLWGEKIPPRMSVYRNNARTNWTDALDSDFPLTRAQFESPAWEILRRSYFIKHPPRHWELNASLASFTDFLASQKIEPYVKELADYEWNDLKIFIDRAVIRLGTGLTNPTASVRVYRHQIFDWVNDDEASPKKPPCQKPEVLVFYRDSSNTRHIQEADPLMLLLLEHFRNPGAELEDLESTRRRLLPGNDVPLASVRSALVESELLL
jgi:hypothetical protein